MMEFRIIDVHSDVDVVVRAPYACVIVPAIEEISLADDEVGFFTGKRSHHHKGIFMQGGILNPGWKGRPTVELLLFGDVQIKRGDEIAHAVILKGRNVAGYVFREG